MSNESTIFSFYENFWKDFFKYTFTYFPTTHWERFISPTFNFIGKNVGDATTEQYVLNEVGSYGMQINRIINVLTVLVKRLNGNQTTTLTEEEKKFVDLFDKLAKDTDEAATKFQAKFREDRIDRMIDDLHSLKTQDINSYNRFVDRLHKEFPRRS